MSEQFVAGNACGNTDDRIREFASLYLGGANNTVDLRVYQALSTIQGGEVISDGF